MGKQSKDQLNSSKCNNKCSMNEFEHRIYPLIDNLKLDKYQKSILKKRFAKLVIQYENMSSSVDCKYNSCRIIISIGSMILPTLQTIQNNENVAEWKNEIFWAAIATSLGVMISNNLISMFALDRRYIMYSITAEKLKAIGWKYFELSDIFSKKTHKENWVSFWNEVEKIKKLQMVAEFTDHDDKPDNKDDMLESSIENKKKNKNDDDYDSDYYSEDEYSPKKNKQNTETKQEVQLKQIIVEKNTNENIINNSSNLINTGANIISKSSDISTLNNLQTEIIDNVQDKISENIPIDINNIGDIANNIKKEL